MRFFFYGTLLDRDVTALVLGRRLPPQAFVPATLPNHARRRVEKGSYPIVVPDPREDVPGAVVRGLSDRDVAFLAAYEGPGYRIAPVSTGSAMRQGMCSMSARPPISRVVSGHISRAIPGTRSASCFASSTLSITTCAPAHLLLPFSKDD